MGQDELPPADMAALREAVLGFYEESIGRLVAQQRRGRPPRRLHPLTLVVLLPWLLLVGVVRMAITRREPQVEVRQQRAVSLYRQLSGKDPAVARAELGRIYQQLMAIDQRVPPSSAQSATADATRRAELAAAAGALLAYHLGGRPPAGPLLTPRGGGETQGAWDATYWLWPLPPPGRLLMVAEWPALHLSETRAEVDADPILEAAALAVTLWPENDDPGGQVGHAPVAGG